ncbi:MAG: hypothetical protein JO097_11505, partial [Acidobacteriaceae bacterium]|nr:hypothetical protein [Acidobacteriaceae bacterium]
MSTAHGFMVADYTAILIAVFLFSFVSFIPGYALGWLLDVMRFRERTFCWRLALSVPLSMAVGPVLSYLTGRWLSMSAVGVMFGVLSIGGIFLLAGEFKRPRNASSRLSRTRFQLFVVLGAWTLIAGLSLADLQFGHRVYFSVIGLDYSVRTAFTNAISTFGFPPRNPFFFPGYPVALRYHYYWLLLPALVQKMSGGLT